MCKFSTLFLWNTRQTSSSNWICLISDAHTIDELKFTWKQVDPLQISSNANIMGFTIGKGGTSTCNSNTITGKRHTILYPFRDYALWFSKIIFTTKPSGYYLDNNGKTRYLFGLGFCMPLNMYIVLNFIRLLMYWITFIHIVFNLFILLKFT